MAAPVEAAATCRSPSIRSARGTLLPETERFVPRALRLIDGRQLTIAPGADTDDKLTAIADGQRARMSRRQLRHAGVADSAIVRRLANGRLVLVHPGVYALPHTLELPFGSETAALLACGDGAMLSHHSAVTLWRLRPGVARPIHITIPRDSAGPKLAGVVVHRSKTLVAADTRVHEGLPVTSPARALLDVAATLPDRDVERLLDEALFALKIITIAEIEDVLARAGSHPGRARVARVVGGRTRSTSADSTKTDSPPEEKLLALIRATGLPDPQLQFYVLDYRLDFFWPELKLAVEVDAYGTHGSPARFESDRRRDARLLTEAGIVVIRLTKAMIEERPLEAVALVARAIGQREAAGRAA